MSQRRFEEGEDALPEEDELEEDELDEDELDEDELDEEELDEDTATVAGYDELIRRFGEDTELSSRERVAGTLLEKGSLLSSMGGDEEGLACFDELLRRYGEASEPSLREWVAEALSSKVSPLWRLKRLEEAQACLDELVRRFGEAPETSLREGVAWALLAQGNRLRWADRPMEALAWYDEVVRRYGEAPEASLRQVVDSALETKIITLRKEGRPEAVLASMDERILRLGRESELSFRKEVARSLFDKGNWLSGKGRHEEALASFDELVRRFGEASEKHLLDWVARALDHKGKLLSRLSRKEEALASFDAIIRRFSASPEAPLREHAQMALSSKEELQKPEEKPWDPEEERQKLEASREASREGLRRQSQLEADPRYFAMDSMRGIYHHFQSVGRGAPPADSLEPPSPGVALYVQEAETLIQRGTDLARQEGQHWDAIASFDEVVRRFGDAVESPLREQLAYPFNCVGTLFRRQGPLRSAPGAEALLRHQVAVSLASSGYWELMDAKRHLQHGYSNWAVESLSLAGDRLYAALKLEPDNLLVWGHAIYIAALGPFKWSVVTNLLPEVLRRGGAKLRAALLEATEYRTSSYDAGFRSSLLKDRS